MSVLWVDVVLDRARPHAAAAASFWAQVSGGGLSPWRAGGSVVTVQPASGDDYLRVQAVDDLAPRGGGHLDLRVADPAAEAARLGGLGAVTVHEEPGRVVLRSPAGLALCLTPCGPAGRGHRAPAVGVPPARLDQVTLDLPSSVFEGEVRFWAAATGWELRGGSAGEFRVLTAAGWGSASGPGDGLQAGPPVRLLLQRLDEQAGPAGVHVDLACADRAATAARHLTLGASVTGRGRRWTVMQDPTGAPYCLTDRDPQTGTLPG